MLFFQRIAENTSYPGGYSIFFLAIQLFPQNPYNLLNPGSVSGPPYHYSQKGYFFLMVTSHLQPVHLHALKQVQYFRRDTYKKKIHLFYLFAEPGCMMQAVNDDHMILLCNDTE